MKELGSLDSFNDKSGDFTTSDIVSTSHGKEDDTNKDFVNFPDVSHQPNFTSPLQASAHEEEPVTSVSIGMIASTDVENRLIVPIQVSGVESDALIDTGATTSMVSSKWLEGIEIGWQAKQPEQAVLGFGANNILPVVGQVELKLKLCSVAMKPQTFLVVNVEQSNRIAFILAEDFLRVNQMTVDVGNNKLSQRVSSGTVDMYIDRDSEFTTVYRGVACAVVEPCVVTDHEFTLVKVQVASEVAIQVSNESTADVPEESLFLFEPSVTRFKSLSLPGFIDPNHPVVLVAAREDTLRLKAGDILGTISTAVIAEEPEPVLEASVATNSSETQQPITLADHLTKAEKEIVRTLLEEQREVFSHADEDVGQLGLTQHRIELLDDTPIYIKPRRFPEPVSEEIEAQCQELYLLDIIEPSKSAYSSPIVPVRKKDGKLRLCVDYRKLNAVTKPDRFPLPNLTDSIYSLHGVKYFSSMDIVRGFYHLRLDETSREVTAFSSPRGHWQFKRLPFGLRNAPAAFQREMQCVLSNFSHGNVIVYIDDVLIMSKGFEEHVEMVRKVLSTLSVYGVKIKATKCTWFQQEVEYLGHVIGRDGIKKAEKFVEKIRDFPRPETVRQLREFLGLANFQRKFVPDFSTVQKPLSVETCGKGKRRVKWSEDMEEAFVKLKKLIAADVMLAFPDYHEDARPLELYVDASAVGAGACLAQSQEEETRIIAYASTTFSHAEYHYSTIERELAALRWGVKALRPFIIGSEFILHTDHQPLIYLHNMKIIDSRLARTLEDLADFNFKIQYTPGKQNGAADALSRLYSPGSVHKAGVDVVMDELPTGLMLIKKVEGGGDSLFESLNEVARCSSLGRPACESALKLRELLIEELLRRPEEYNVTLNRDQRKQLRLMCLPGQLPCVEVLYAFGQQFKCCVVVHYGVGNGVNFISPQLRNHRNLPRVHLQCLAGVHYNPVVELKSYSHPEVSDTEEIVKPCSGLRDEEHGEEVDEEPSVGALQLGCLVEEPEPASTWCLLHRRAHLTSVMISLEGIMYCALLDSGAQISCVSRSVVDRHSISVDHSVSYLVSGLGTGTARSMGVARIQLQFPGLKDAEAHPLAIVPDTTMPYCFILGVDFLKDYRLSIDCNRGACMQNGEPVCWFDGFAGSQWLSSLAMTSTIPKTVVELCIGSAADGLRFAVEQDQDGIRLATLISTEEVYLLQKRSRLIAQLKRQLKENDRHWPKSIGQFRRHRDLLVVNGDILCHKNVPVVTFTVLVEVMLVIHYQMSHIGRQKLIEMTRANIWHPSISTVAGDITSSCDWCQKMKVASVVAPPTYKVQTSIPFELLTLDLVNLPKSEGCNSALVVVDHNSKWMNVVPLSSKTSSSVALAFERKVLPVLPRRPDKVLSDNGPEFVGAAFNQLIDSYGIEHIYTTPNRPPSNGLVERTNRTLLELLRVSPDAQHRWMELLPRAVVTYNHTFHCALDCSPSEYLLSRVHAVRPTPVVSREERNKWKEGNPSFGTFRIGQHVLKKTVLVGNETSNKFKQRFQGPYVVIKVNQNGVTYQVKDSTTAAIFRAHHGQLKSYVEVPRYIKRHPYYQQTVNEKVAVENTEGEGRITQRTWDSAQEVDLPQGECGAAVEHLAPLDWI